MKVNIPKELQSKTVWKIFSIPFSSTFLISIGILGITCFFLQGIIASDFKKIFYFYYVVLSFLLLFKNKNMPHKMNMQVIGMYIYYEICKLRIIFKNIGMIKTLKLYYKKVK